MGIRFRKSVNLGGGFKINLSKSGVGYSWGVPGYRITKTASGKTRKTYSVPGTGISHSSQSSSKKKTSSLPKKQSAKATESSYILNTTELGLDNIDNYQSADYQELLNAIRNYNRWQKISNILLWCALLIGITPLLLILPVAGIILKIYVYKNLTIPISFEFDEATREEYDKRYASWKSLNKSKMIWKLLSSSTVKDKKQTAGAENLIKRERIGLSEHVPKFFKTKEKFIRIHTKKEDLYFMPDKLLIIQKSKIGAVSYADLKVSIKEYPFIEGEQVPNDAEIIKKTWLKVNKNGSPDKRFKGNRQIPVCKYGLICLKTSTGMDMRICFSNTKLLETLTL